MPTTTDVRVRLHNEDHPETLRLLRDLIGLKAPAGWYPTEHGALVDFDELDHSFLSSTEKAVCRIAQGLAVLEWKGGAGRMNQPLMSAVNAVVPG